MWGELLQHWGVGRHQAQPAEYQACGKQVRDGCKARVGMSPQTDTVYSLQTYGTYGMQMHRAKGRYSMAPGPQCLQSADVKDRENTSVAGAGMNTCWPAVEKQCSIGACTLDPAARTVTPCTR
jgi:hypothetical protein